MIEMRDILRQLTANAAAIRALVSTLTPEQARWKPDADTWCMQEVMEHVYNEERIDFRAHLKEMFQNPPLAWGSLPDTSYHPVEDCRQSLELFLAERENSLAWLRGLDSVDWEITIQTPFGPAGQTKLLRAGEVLASWTAHDYLHIRQMNELLFAWNEKQAAPYSVAYAGGW